MQASVLLMDILIFSVADGGTVSPPAPRRRGWLPPNDRSQRPQPNRHPSRSHIPTKELLLVINLPIIRISDTICLFEVKRQLRLNAVREDLQKRSLQHCTI